MKSEKADAESVWKQIEDVLVAQLGLSVVDRAVYWHLLRHSRLEGKPRLHFSIAGLARSAGVSYSGAREAVRRLLEQGILRLLKRNHTGQTVEVRLPEEIGLDVRSGRRSSKRREEEGVDTSGEMPEGIDFLASESARKAIHARERGLCFYCLRQLEEQDEKTLDHVVPRVDGGGNSYRNLVSCCAGCNWYKKEMGAGDFLRRLYREGWLVGSELRERMGALRDLVAGKLRPVLDGMGTAMAGLCEPAGASADAGPTKVEDNNVGKNASLALERNEDRLRGLSPGAK
jgi:predicted transcriptional regulator